MKQPSNGVFVEDGCSYLVRCPRCGRENYAVNVASGICTWCGYDANAHNNDEYDSEGIHDA